MSRSPSPKTVGVERRAAFYEETGALRDMVPNMSFKLLSLTAMEPPNSLPPTRCGPKRTRSGGGDPARRQRCAPQRGARQYTAGVVRGVPIKAYREEEGVAPDSMTGNLCRAAPRHRQLALAGVPFLRTGRR